MNCSFQIILVSCISAIVLGQSTTCSNNNLLMTPTLRQKVLNVLNLARNKLESGQLLLNNGEYAVQAASLPDLTWSCELEEEMFERMEESCDSPLNADLQSLGLTWTFNRFDDSDAETLVDAMLENQSVLTGFYHVQLSRHNLYLEPISTFGTQIIALSDKAQYVACAIQNCNISAVSSGWALPGEIMNNIYCKVSLTEQLEFGDEIYQISPSVVNYIPPSQDVVCPSSGMVIEQREAVLEKINAARSQISQSNYPLPNGNNALPPAQPLSPLLWSCEDENAMAVEKVIVDCSSAFDAATEFKKSVGGISFTDYNSQNLLGFHLLNWWSELGTEFFVQNPNLNFLSQSSTYSTQYPAAFALSSQAETIACTLKVCFGSPSSFDFICRVKPSLQINKPLYQI